VHERPDQDRLPKAGSLMSRSPRVVDFSTHVSGPLAAGILTQLGADVIKIENPRTGDGNRFVPPMIEGLGALHWALNAGSRSFAVDRRSPHWPEVVEASARWADVVIVGMRPHDANAIGIGYETITAANPDVIYCSLTGYGDKGPWAAYTGHGINFDARAGMLPVDITDTTAAMSTAYTVPSGTTAAGVLAALGIFAALYHRTQGRPPCYVDVSIWHAAMWWNLRSLTTLANTGRPWPPFSDFGSRYSLYRTRDARAILLAPIEQKFWIAFCDIIGLPDTAKGRGDWATGMDWGKGYEDERAFIAERISTRTLDDWVELFAASSVPFAPVLTSAEALQSEQARASDVMTQLDTGEFVPRLAVGVRDKPGIQEAWRPHRAPDLGEHTNEILDLLGLEHLRAKLTVKREAT
jgi:crotonobetainyl-CoA:carnitine CoA-transferase CaiB-like acyl-CoA transferase